MKLAFFIIVMFLGLGNSIAYSADRALAPKAHQIVAQVDGVVCSFCAYGLEKNLSNIPGIDKSKFGDGVLVNVKDGTVTMVLKAGEKANFDRILKAIQDGGYLLRHLDLLVQGQIRKTNSDIVIIDEESGQTFWLQNSKGHPWEGPMSEKSGMKIHIRMSAKSLEDQSFQNHPYAEVLGVIANS